MNLYGTTLKKKANEEAARISKYTFRIFSFECSIGLHTAMYRSYEIKTIVKIENNIKYQVIVFIYHKLHNKKSSKTRQPLNQNGRLVTVLMRKQRQPKKSTTACDLNSVIPCFEVNFFKHKVMNNRRLVVMPVTNIARFICLKSWVTFRWYPILGWVKDSGKLDVLKSILNSGLTGVSCLTEGFKITRRGCSRWNLCGAMILVFNWRRA